MPDEEQEGGRREAEGGAEFALPLALDAEGGGRETGGGGADAEGAVSPVRLRLAAILEVVACSGFPTQLAIAGALGFAGMQAFDAHGRLSVRYVFILSVGDAVLLVGLVAWFLRLHNESIRGVLFGRRPLLPEGLFGILQVPAVFGLVVVVLAVTRHVAPWLHNVPTNPMAGLIATRLDAWLFGFVALVGGGVREEVQRAFVLHRFEQHLGGAWVGLVVFSLLFGAGHVIQGYDVAVATAALGLFWGLMYLQRRSIASTVVSHSCFNAVEIVRFAVGGV